MSYFVILCFGFVITVKLSGSNPVRSNLGVSPVDVEYDNPYCDEAAVYEWTGDFHECFMERKYNDGGRDLDTIIDRILEHGEVCVKTSKKDCRPDFHGFKILLGKVIEQMKDYSEMYLEEIRKGREDMKDLNCMENTISMRTYEKCFERLSQNTNLDKEKLQRIVKEGILCTNKAYEGCSKEAKTSLNRIVRIVFAVEQPAEEEDLEEEIQIKPTEPPPMEWYEYIYQPFVYAWNAIKSWFGW